VAKSFWMEIGKTSTMKRKADTRHTNREKRGFSVRDYPFFFMHQIIHKNNANIGDALRSRGLTPTIWRILAILQERDGMHIGALSQESVIERTLLSRIIAALERRGLVRREPYKPDKRYTAVFLEAAGRRTFHEILPIARRQIEIAVAGLKKNDLKLLQTILGHITENVNRSPYG
jgi:MarR family transcriptional regulator, organic hydroperoxide resistance regulator